MNKKSSLYRELCKSALNYKKGYTSETSFINDLSSFVYNRIYNNVNDYMHMKNIEMKRAF